MQMISIEYFYGCYCSPAFSVNNQRDSLLIIQCDSGHVYGDLIACARYRIDDVRAKANQRNTTTHVLFIVHLPRLSREAESGSSTFVGFQGGPWISVHIDDIRDPSATDLMLEASNTPISELFYNKGFISHDDGDGDGRDGHDQMDTASGPLHVVEQDSVMGPLEEMEVEDGGSSQLEYSKEKAMNDGEIDDDIIIEVIGNIAG